MKSLMIEDIPLLNIQQQVPPMITKIALTRLHNPEVMGYGTDFIAIVKKSGLAQPALTAATALFEASINALKNVYAKEKGSPLSIQVEQQDERRDKAITGIKLTCEAQLRHFTAANVAAADVVLRCMAKYSPNIAKESYLKETEMLRNLVVDFEAAGAVKDALALLGLTAWVAEMKDANEQFNTVYLARNAEISQGPQSNATDMRLPVREHYEGLIKVIAALETLDPSPALEGMVKEANGITAQYQLLIDRRGNKGSTDGDTPE